MLFRIRWDTDDTNERSAFAKSLDLGLDEVSKEEIELWKDALIAATGLRKKDNSPLDTYFKVPWTRVTELVSTRRVFLRNGYAYVPMREQSSIVFQEFSSRLQHALEVRTSSAQACTFQSNYCLLDTHK